MRDGAAGWRLAAPALLLIAGGCIPQVDPPYRDAPPAAAARYPSSVADAALPDDDTRPPPETSVMVTTGRDRYLPAERTPMRAARRPTQSQPRPRPPAPIEPLPPAPRPVWEARPVTPDVATVAERRWEVRPGDTLSSIAERTGAGSGAIAHANGLLPPFTLLPGRSLVIPGGRYHLVRPGQSGIAIARAYGVEWSRIVAANDLAEPFVLRAGERVLIPDAPAGASRLADRAAAFRLDIDDILTGGEPAPAPRQAFARPARSAARVLPATAVVAPPARFDGGFVWPVDGRITRHFGRGGIGERNDGIEIAAPLGQPIRAAASGVVAYVGDGIAALGGLVLIKHGDGWTSVYGHAGKLLVRRGQAVRQGQTVALSGDTGRTDRPEVHFELRKGRTPVDPLTELPRRAG